MRRSVCETPHRFGADRQPGDPAWRNGIYFGVTYPTQTHANPRQADSLKKARNTISSQNTLLIQKPIPGWDCAILIGSLPDSSLL